MPLSLLRPSSPKSSRSPTSSSSSSSIVFLIHFASTNADALEQRHRRRGFDLEARCPRLRPPPSCRSCYQLHSRYPRSRTSVVHGSSGEQLILHRAYGVLMMNARRSLLPSFCLSADMMDRSEPSPSSDSLLLVKSSSETVSLPHRSRAPLSLRANFNSSILSSAMPQHEPRRGRDRQQHSRGRSWIHHRWNGAVRTRGSCANGSDLWCDDGLRCQGEYSCISTDDRWLLIRSRRRPPRRASSFTTRTKSSRARLSPKRSLLPPTSSLPPFFERCLFSLSKQRAVK